MFKVARPPVLVVSVALLSANSFGQLPASSKLIVFLQGRRVGLMVAKDYKTLLGKTPVKRSDSEMTMGAAMLGSALNISIKSSTWTDLTGRPLRMSSATSSGGRVQSLLATIGKSSAVIQISNSGSKSTKKIAIPTDAPLIDDPITKLVLEGTPSKQQTFYVLDPVGCTFVKNKVVFRGASETTIGQTRFQAKLVEVIDPRASYQMFLNTKNELLKVIGPMGMEMIPEKLAPMGEAGSIPDLASLSAIPAEGNLPPARRLSKLHLSVSGQDLNSLPSDTFQTVKKVEGGWDVTIHPLDNPDLGQTIDQVSNSQKAWTKPGLNIPSDSVEFVKLAKQVLKGETKAVPAAVAIKNYVHAIMHPNAGIGVVRDASEVLKTKEGVCRDYAILTVALLRAAKIPARLATGLVVFEGKFYYHAWAEAWNGESWFGLDSTLPEDRIHAGHVKLSQGSVEDAYTFVFLDRVKVKVIDFNVKMN